MGGDPELIFLSTTKVCLRDGMLLTREVSLRYRPLCSAILPSFDSLPSSDSFYCVKKKKSQPFNQHPLSSVPSLISSKGEAYLINIPHFTKCQLKSCT